MISVTLDTSRPSLSIEGHAHYAEPGRDIVCAAASILACTLASRIRSLAGPGEILETSMEPGRVCVVTHPDSQHRQAFISAFETVREGFLLLARQYPSHVSLSETHERRIICQKTSPLHP